MSPMNPNPNALDGLLSDYFKSRMPQPWPAAPLPGLAVPSSVAVAQHRPATDANRRARLTLAASVALLLGTGWYLAGGLQPISRSVSKPGGGAGPSILDSGTASRPSEFDRSRDKAKATPHPMTGFQPGPIELP